MPYGVNNYFLNRDSLRQMAEVVQNVAVPEIDFHNHGLDTGLLVSGCGLDRIQQDGKRNEVRAALRRASPQ